MKDPERYLNEQKIDLRCVVHAGGRAKFDPAHRAYVNYEIFFFSNRAARGRFLQNPVSYCGWLTDPVSRVRFRPTPSSPRLLFRGRTYYFAVESSRAMFKSMPDSFAVRKGM